MQIGNGATVTITNSSKQGGLVAIYYLGTLVGALLYALAPFKLSIVLPISNRLGADMSPTRSEETGPSYLLDSGVCWDHHCKWQLRMLTGCSVLESSLALALEASVLSFPSGVRSSLHTTIEVL